MADTKKYLVNPGTQFLTFSKITLPVINVTTVSTTLNQPTTSTADTIAKSQSNTNLSKGLS